jgi:hypothetical protein
MSSTHKRNQAKYEIESPGWPSSEAALTEMREAALFGRESILKKLKDQNIAYDADDCPNELDHDADVIL